jgi:TolB-like protein
VLPVENLGAGSDHEYLAAGLTESNRGSRPSASIGVIGRTSMMAYKGDEITPRSAVSWTPVSGGSSIRGEGGRVRITAEADSRVRRVLIWSASYDSEPGSVLGSSGS